MNRAKKALILLGLILALPVASIAIEPEAYVVNTLGESLSRINLLGGTVDNDVVTLGSDIGSSPNKICIQDSLAFVVNSLTDEIQIIDLNSLTTDDFISVGTGENPYWMEFYDSRYAFVTTLLGNELLKVDVLDRTVVGRDSIGVAPEGIAIADHKAYIACTGLDFGTFQYGPGKVAVWDIVGDSLLTEIPVGTNPQFAAVDDFGRLPVCCTGNYATVFGVVYIVDIASDMVIDSVTIGGSPGQITIAPDHTAYLAAGGFTMNGYVFSYSSNTLEVFHDNSNPIEVSQNCLAVSAYRDSTLFAASFTDFVTVVDSSGANLNTFAVGDGPVHVEFVYRPGDISGDFEVDLTDLGVIVDFMFGDQSAALPKPRWPANVNGDFSYDLSDLGLIVEFLFSEPGTVTLHAGPKWVLHN
jgi:hypothetical protein